MKKLLHLIHKVRRKIARVALGVDTAQGKVRRHRAEHHRHARLTAKAFSSGQLAEGKREHARALHHMHKLSQWEARLKFLQRKHRYLQLLLDRRLARKAKWLREHPDTFKPSSMGPNFVTFDGHDLPKWIAKIDQEARDAGYWNGYVISGVRSPEYSEQLCLNMCGAPSCSGLCAGRSSNHACPPSGAGVEYEGAEDVTDSAGLRRFCEERGKPLIGGGRVLPLDTPHFSHQGN